MAGALDPIRMLLISLRTAVAALVALAKSRPVGEAVTLAPGDAAPDFSLHGSDGRVYQLSEFRGRSAVVLAWFPKAFTPGCTAECRSLQASAAALNAAGVRYFAVSTDAPETNRSFASEVGLEYPVLSDTDGSVGRAYGVVGRIGLASRWTFYIDRDGRVAAIDKAVRPTSHGDAVLARVAELGLGRAP